MLRILREHASSWMLRGILILVAVTFISWGGYSLIREKKPTYAAKVNGELVGLKEYHETFQNVIKRYREALGSAFNEKMIEEMKIKEKVLEELISRLLVLQEGKRLGLKTTNEELRKIIESYPSFQVNGQFDPRLYERFLRLNRMNAGEFEQMQKEDLLYHKVVNLIKLSGGKVSEGEILEAYLFENERVNLQFIKIPFEAYQKEVKVNDIEIKDYYQKHQEEFRIPHSIKVQYLSFRPSDFEATIQISQEELKRAYEFRKESFKSPKRVKAREILIAVDPQDSSEKVEEKRKKAEEILDKAQKTKDFATLAKQYSHSPTASKGGELGWMNPGTLEEALEKVLFSTKVGELSKVVRGKAGFYIFKVEEVVEEKQKSLDEVKDQLSQSLIKEKAKKEASRRADDAFYDLFRRRELEAYAREKNIPIKMTGYLKEGDEVPEIGRDPSFYSAALSLRVGEISPVLSLGPNFYILKLIDKKESRIPSIEEVKEEVKQRLILIKAEERARAVSGEILKEIKGGKEIKEVAKERGFSVGETGLFNRASGMIPKIGPAMEWLPMLSSLSEKDPVPREVFKSKEGFFVVKLTKLEAADPGKFQSYKKTLEKRLIYQRQEELFRNWLEQLREKAKIEINREIL
ncbi:MAG: SurA N-terminal domain-containing protein [Thermodesulfobacteriota bacterium]